MSFLKSKHNGWLSDGTRTPFSGGGSGGGGGATQTTAYNTNIPEYARPYVETMLGATQKQLFDMDDTGITGFKPYTPYSTDVNQYFAGFSPLQQKAQQASYNLQAPQQFGAATDLASASGLGSLGLAGQAAGAGQQYSQMAQDPRAMQGFMSPYMQNVVDFQKQSALRDYQVAQPMRQAQAVAKGAFGGSRQAIENAEAQRNLNTQLQGITATGTQKAFEDAQRQQQFGAQLGMQGLQTGLQGLGQAGQAASTLGGLGAQQFGAQKDIINLQSQMGAQQQALEQSKINQAIQDYAIQQQYPMMQLGFMSNMLRGLPMQSQTTQLYQAQPSALQQGIGLAGAGASLFGAGRAEGGAIKMAEGGIADYKYGGAIPEPKLESMADNLSVEQLQARIKDPALTPGERQVFQEALAAKQQTIARSSGIAAAGGGLFDTMGYAGGGILAFAEGDVVEDPQFGGGPGLDADQARLDQLKLQKDLQQYEFLKTSSPVAAERMLNQNPMLRNMVAPPAPAPAPAPKPTAAPTANAAPAGPSAGATGSKASSGAGSETSGIGGILAGLRKEGPQGELGADYLKRLQDLEAGADKRLSKADRIAMAKGFLKFGSTPAPGGIGQAAVAGLGEYTEGYSKALESDEKFRMENAKLQSDIQNLRRAEERGDVKLAAELQEKIEDRANRLQTANISASASNRAGDREDKAIQQIMKDKGLSYADAYQFAKGAGKFESNDITRAKAALAQINEQLTFMKKDDPARAALIAQRDQITKSLTSGGSMQPAGGGAPTFRFDANGNLVKG
jgi:hypothetical protein